MLRWMILSILIGGTIILSMDKKTVDLQAELTSKQPHLDFSDGPQPRSGVATDQQESGYSLSELRKMDHAQPAVPIYYRGAPCSEDCSGHEAGYEWAEENSIEDLDDCDGNSASFVEGCQTYAEDQSPNHDGIDEDSPEESDEFGEPGFDMGDGFLTGFCHSPVYIERQISGLRDFWGDILKVL